jgi:ubiquitin carboxyl-terminal hydrolase L5
MELARPIIEERMQCYEGDQIQFNLLSLCKSPLLTVPRELAANVKALQTIEAHLGYRQSDWQQFVGRVDSGSVLRGPSHLYRLTQELLNTAQLPSSIISKLGNPDIDTESLFRLREELTTAQRPLRAAIVDEGAAIDQDNARAVSRRHDYTPMIHAWIRFLADNGNLQDIVKAAER